MWRDVTVMTFVHAAPRCRRLCDAEVFVFEAFKGFWEGDISYDRQGEVWILEGFYAWEEMEIWEWADDGMRVEKLEMIAGAWDGYSFKLEMKALELWDENVTGLRWNLESACPFLRLGGVLSQVVRWNCDGAWWGACSQYVTHYSLNLHILDFGVSGYQLKSEVKLYFRDEIIGCTGRIVIFIPVMRILMIYWLSRHSSWTKDAEI
jgi:hypothetical protein